MKGKPRMPECQNLGVRPPQRKFESKKGGVAAWNDPWACNNWKDRLCCIPSSPKINPQLLIFNDLPIYQSYGSLWKGYFRTMHLHLGLQSCVDVQEHLLPGHRWTPPPPKLLEPEPSSARSFSLKMPWEGSGSQKKSLKPDVSLCLQIFLLLNFLEQSKFHQVLVGVSCSQPHSPSKISHVTPLAPWAAPSPRPAPDSHETPPLFAGVPLLQRLSPS